MMRADAKVGAQVELNPKLLAFIIGEKESVIESVIEKMCRPDAESRSPDEGGKRLVQVGQFDYRVVNGAKYLAIRNEEERRESARQRKEKSRKLKMDKHISGEMGFVKAGQGNEFQEVAIPAEGKTIEQAVRDARSEGSVKPRSNFLPDGDTPF